MLGGDDPSGDFDDLRSFAQPDRPPSASERIPGGRIPPHHSEAERSVLGAILLNNESIHRVLEIGLDARDF